MEDLLKEEEFAEAHHDPWKSFKLFYKIAAVVSFAFIGARRLDIMPDSETFIFLSIFLIPPVTAVFMFRHHKRNIEISRKVKLLGISGLAGSFVAPFYIVVAGLMVYRGSVDMSYDDVFSIFLAGLILFAVFFCISSFVILVMSYFRESRGGLG